MAPTTTTHPAREAAGEPQSVRDAYDRQWAAEKAAYQAAREAARTQGGKR